MKKQSIKPGKVHFIIKVIDLEKSKMFYKILFGINPIVDEDNICEFKIGNKIIIGLITNSLIEKIVDPDLIASLIPMKNSFSELYFEVTNAEQYHQRALQLGCIEVSSFQKRGWGHSVGYSITHDSTLLAFAETPQ